MSISSSSRILRWFRSPALLACLLAVTLGAAPTPRIVAVGDVHGAGDAFVSILQKTGLIDAQKRWAGGTAILVQTGDLLDRGQDVRQILDLLMALERLGFANTRKENYARALEYLGQAQQVGRDLSTADPKNVVVRRDLMSIMGNIAETQRLAGRTDDAIASVSQAIAMIRELLAINPKAAQYRADLAELESGRAEMLAQKSDFDGALAGYEISRTALETLTTEDAQNVNYKESLAVVYQAMGHLARKRQPGGAEACQRYRQAADLFASMGPRLSAAHTATAKEVEQLVQECSAK